jgi:hypothetical protein
MADERTSPASSRGRTKPIPPALRPSARLEAKQLDAALVAALRRRKRELSVFPGIPFN